MRKLKEKWIGPVLVAQYLQERDHLYYLEAEGPNFRVWRMTRDPERADELFSRFKFWSWLIVAIPSRLFLRVAAFFMRR